MCVDPGLVGFLLHDFDDDGHIAVILAAEFGALAAEGPTSVARNHVVLTIPGIASFLIASSGTYQACSTSFDVIIRRTFVLTGTTSGLSTSRR